MICCICLCVWEYLNIHTVRFTQRKKCNGYFSVLPSFLGYQNEQIISHTTWSFELKMHFRTSQWTVIIRKDMHMHFLCLRLISDTEKKGGQKNSIDGVHFNTTLRQKLLVGWLCRHWGAGRDAWAVPVEVPLRYGPESYHLSGRELQPDAGLRSNSLPGTAAGWAPALSHKISSLSKGGRVKQAGTTREKRLWKVIHTHSLCVPLNQSDRWLLDTELKQSLKTQS